MLERIKFMKVNRHKRFDYTPRYYDERKERLEKIKSRYASNDETITNEEIRERMRQKIEENWNNNAQGGVQSRAANLRLIVILVALLAAAYFFLDYVEIFTAEVTVLEDLNK